MTSFVTAKYGSDKNQILDPNSIGTPATVTTDPVTGKVRKFTGIDLPGFTLANTAKFHGGRVDSSAVATSTFHLAFTLPRRAMAMRVAVPKSCTISGGSTVDAVSIAPTASVVASGGDFMPTGSTLYEYLTFQGGSAGVTQAYETGNVAEREVVWSDWSPVYSLDRTDVVGAPPAYGIRCYCASTNTTLVGNSAIESAMTGSPYPLPFKTWFKTGDFASSDQAGFTAPAAVGSSPIITIQWIAEDLSVGVTGVADYVDSISSGFNTTQNGLGLVQRLYRQALAISKYVSPHMSSLAGRGAYDSYRAYVSEAASLPPGTIVFYRPYTRNSGTNPDSVRLACCASELARKYGHRLVLETGIYESATTANNANMVATNILVRALAASMGLLLCEQEATFNASNFVSGGANTADGIHPNDAGAEIMTAVRLTALTTAGYI